MKTIKLMCDYYCYPLWESTEDGLNNVDPKSLPITENLQKELMAWAETYDAILNRSDPASTAFPSPEAKEKFIQTGLSLAMKLKNMLGKEFKVFYKVSGQTIREM